MSYAYVYPSLNTCMCRINEIYKYMNAKSPATFPINIYINKKYIYIRSNRVMMRSTIVHYQKKKEKKNNEVEAEDKETTR